MNTASIVIIAAAALAVLVVILLVTRVIKAFAALILILIIAVAGFFGVRYLNDKTSLSGNVASIQQAFEDIKKDYPQITGIQDNMLSEDLGISVFYIVTGDRDDALIQEVLLKTREALLGQENFKDMTEQFDGAVPKSIGVTFTFDKLDVASYTAKRTASDDISQPDGMYTSFDHSDDK